MPRAKAPFLHVANGTSTTLLIEAAGIPGIVSIWADPLFDGPVPGSLTDAELVEARARHLASARGARRSANGRPAGAVTNLRRWRAAIEADTAYDELVLWFEHDLFDQLNLIQLLTWLRERLPRSKAVSLVCIRSFPGHPHFKGLGELRATELASLLEVRQHVGEAQYSLARAAWGAFREPTPEALDELRQQDTTPLPFLAAGLSRFLQEYPWTTDGLSRSERRLMELAADGSIRLHSAFERMHDGEDAYYITDSSIEDLVEALSSSPAPLMVREPGESGDDLVLAGSATLTDTGRAVLAARQDRVATCGIDRWFGGTYLRGSANVWRWDDTLQRVRRQ